MDSFTIMTEQLSKGDASALPEMHAILSGLKTLVTTTSVADVETARRSMGGHGFSAYAGLGVSYANQVPSATCAHPPFLMSTILIFLSYEGDNFVLDQQVVRAALKAYGHLASSENLTPFMGFLRLVRRRAALPNNAVRTTPDWGNWTTAVSVLEWRAAKIVEDRADAEARKEVDSNSDQRTARAITEAYVAKQVTMFIESIPRHLPEASGRILKALFKLVCSRPYTERSRAC